MVVLPGGEKKNGRNNEVTVLRRWLQGGVPLYNESLKNVPQQLGKENNMQYI